MCHQKVTVNLSDGKRYFARSGNLDQGISYQCMPPSTITSSTIYSLSCTSTTNVYSNCLSTLYPYTFSQDLSRNLPPPPMADYNGLSSSPFLQSRARCRSPPAQPSDTSPGERGATPASASIAATATPATTTLHLFGAIGLSSQQPQPQHMELDQATAATAGTTAVGHNKMDTWPESFQDLRSWCHPDQDELNTPQITMQDEFNFSPEGQANNCEWGYVQSPVELNDQLLNQDILLASPNTNNNNNVMMDEENNNFAVIDIQGNFTSYNIEEDGTRKNGTSLGKSMMNRLVVNPGSSTPALKTKASDVLLSQAIGAITPKSEDPLLIGGSMLGGNNYLDIKLNSSQEVSNCNNTPLMRLGSGGTLVFRMDEEKSTTGAAGRRTEDFRVPVRTKEEDNGVTTSVAHPPPRPAGKPHRPKLKPLNIPQQQQQHQQQQQQQPPATTNTSNLFTPDVLKPLTDTNGFNLLSYITEGEVIGPQGAVGGGKDGTVPLQDHDYAESVPDENVHIKMEPLSPASSGVGSSRGGGGGGRGGGSSIISGGGERGGGGRRTSSCWDEDDFHMGGGEDGFDSDVEEWLPGSSSKAQSGGSRRGRKPSIGIDSLDGEDRYRTLRDRNNEASRRSRQNRKQRDLEIRKHKTELERKNAVLKVKADRMETLVKEMRAALLQSVRNSRNAMINT